MKKLVYMFIIGTIVLYAQQARAYLPFSSAVTYAQTVGSDQGIAQISAVNAQMKVLLDFITHAQDTVLPIVQKMATDQERLFKNIKKSSLTENEKAVLNSQLNQINTTLKELLERVTSIPPEVKETLTTFSTHIQEAINSLKDLSDN